MTIKEISHLKNLPTEKMIDPEWFYGWILTKFQETDYYNFIKVLVRKRRSSQQLILWSGIHLIPTPARGGGPRKSRARLSHKHRYKKSSTHKILANWSQHCIKKITLSEDQSHSTLARKGCLTLISTFTTLPDKWKRTTQLPQKMQKKSDKMQ